MIKIKELTFEHICENKKDNNFSVEYKEKTWVFWAMWAPSSISRIIYCPMCGVKLEHVDIT